MANLFSDLLTLRDTVGTITDASTYVGEVVTTKSFFDVTSNPANNDVIMMLDIPSNAKPHAIWLHNEDIGTGSVIDWGIYASRKFTDTDGTLYEENQVILVNAFDDASAILNTAFLDFHTELRFQVSGSSTSLTRVGDAMWQLCNLDSDPHIPLRIGAALPTQWSVFVGGILSLTVNYAAK